MFFAIVRKYVKLYVAVQNSYINVKAKGIHTFLYVKYRS